MQAADPEGEGPLQILPTSPLIRSADWERTDSSLQRTVTGDRPPEGNGRHLWLRLSCCLRPWRGAFPWGQEGLLQRAQRGVLRKKRLESTSAICGCAIVALGGGATGGPKEVLQTLSGVAPRKRGSFRAILSPARLTSQQKSKGVADCQQGELGSKSKCESRSRLPQESEQRAVGEVKSSEEREAKPICFLAAGVASRQKQYVALSSLAAPPLAHSVVLSPFPSRGRKCSQCLCRRAGGCKCSEQ